MIQVENIFIDVFKNIESVGNHNPLFFHFGNQKELDAIIQKRQENQVYTYPLIWYLMPNELKVNNGFAIGECTFVIAHNTRLEWFNDQRFRNVFNEILQPNFDIALRTLRRSPSISVLDFPSGEEYRYTNFPNYGKATSFDRNNGSQAEAINYWDALKFTVNLQIHDGCKC